MPSYCLAVLLGSTPALALAFWVGPHETGREGVLWSLWCVCGAWATGLVLARSAVRGESPPRSPDADSARRCGPYQLGESLGAGGMGTVFRAVHRQIGRPAALKLLSSATRRDDERRFEREVRLLGELRHPNIVRLYDHGRSAEGLPYYAMELLSGRDLQRLIDRSGAQEPRRVVHLLLQICDALAAAHALGIVHRDVKPANVWLCGGDEPDRVKLLDFGLAKHIAAGAPELTLEQALVGTPSNMAPECFIAPASVGPLADLYGVGTVAYALLTGRPVFTGGTLVEIGTQHLHVEPPSVSERAPYPISPQLERVVRRCLAKDPRQRPDTAQVLRAALLACPEAGQWSRADAEAWWRSEELGQAEPVGSEAERLGSEAERLGVDLTLVDRTSAPSWADTTAPSAPPTWAGACRKMAA